jgi:hypothetical protein
MMAKKKGDEDETLVSTTPEKRRTFGSISKASEGRGGHRSTAWTGVSYQLTVNQEAVENV